MGGTRAAGNDGDLPRVIEGEAHAVRLCLIASSPVDGRRTHRSDAAGIEVKLAGIDRVDDCDIREHRSRICGNEVRVCYGTGGDIASSGNGKQPHAAR